MAVTYQAFITPKLVKWARERVQATYDAIADKLAVETQEVVSWEQGRVYPNLRQARELAAALKIPFGYLYLSSPPIEKTPLPDFRTIGTRRRTKLSAEFRDTLNDALLKQDWYKEYLREDGRERLQFIGKFSLEDDVYRVADDIRQTLGVNDTLRTLANTWEDFLSGLVRNCESKGIIVLRNSVVGSNTHRPLSVREFRGFNIADDLAPLIFINTRDAKTAQIFTLVHEIVHLWIGKSGISNSNLVARTSDPINKVERFCNQTAAEVLIPEAGFSDKWDEAIDIEANLSHLSREYKVSASVVLRRAYELDIISYTMYTRLLKREMAIWKRRKERRQEGGNIQYLVLSRNSTNLAIALIGEAMEGRISPRDAERMLGVGMDAIGKISEKLTKTA
jgi:Zn-dependent peptidase ImmA (M78 family)/DNA-binding XRE family transcriptional regulator